MTRLTTASALRAYCDGKALLGDDVVTSIPYTLLVNSFCVVEQRCTFDVIVIGGGTFGLALAQDLFRLLHHVRVQDKSTVGELATRT